jgi:hypothetical protein
MEVGFQVETSKLRISKKNVSLGAARDPPHIPKNRDHGLRGVSAVRDVLLNFWEVSQEKSEKSIFTVTSFVDDPQGGFMV